MRIFSLATVLAIAVLAAGNSVLRAAGAVSPRDALFNDGWKFHLGDISGAEKSDFKDADWRSVQLPHDYAIEGVPAADPSTMQGPFDPKSAGGAGGGSLDAGPAWYRKTFTLPASAKGQRIAIHFDGVYMDADFYLNGKKLGNHPYGYTPIEYDITDALNWSAPNTLAVHLNVEQPCSRWYSGAGIYRNVHLLTRNPIHIATDGTYIVPDAKTGTVTVHTQIVNDSDAAASVDVLPQLSDPSGKEISQDIESKSWALKPHATVDLVRTWSIPNPQLWSVDTPRLYTLTTQLQAEPGTVDESTTRFGFRTIQFTADNGFLLNGQRLQIQGTCNHHDLGALGSAFNVHAARRQLQLLKDMGCNALRTSHNPPDPQFLDLADEMGFVVMDEAFDEWKRDKTKFGYGRFFDQWSDADLTAMIHRDRNHPSIVLWSIGNEIPEQGPPKKAAGASADTTPYTEGAAMAKHFADLVHREDPTRFVTSACNNEGSAAKTGFADALDVFGLNYHDSYYKQFKGRILLASETTSAVSTRGEYGLELDANGNVTINHRPTQQCTSYDLDKPGWGSTAEESILALRNAPWMAGEFVWTGFDYIGEPTPYKYPSRSSYFGIIDLAGFPKDRYYIYQSQWTTKPMVHLLPHWNWKGFEGKEIPVQAYTTGDSAELFLNGKSLGTRDFKNNKTLHLEWKVPYTPGTLKVVAYKDGKQIATDSVTTAGDPAKIELLVDRSQIKADGDDLSFVTVRVEDKDGNLCPNADNEIHFDLAGPATLAGLDNGDPINHEEFQNTKQHKAFHGLALAIVRSTQTAGEITLAVSGTQLPVSAATITTTP